MKPLQVLDVGLLLVCLVLIAFGVFAHDTGVHILTAGVLALTFAVRLFKGKY